MFEWAMLFSCLALAWYGPEHYDILVLLYPLMYILPISCTNFALLIALDL